MANLLNERLNLSDNNMPGNKKKHNKKEKKHKKNTIAPIKETIKPITKEKIKKDIEFDEKIEALSGEDYVKEQKKLKSIKRRFQFVKLFMCFLCGYLLFLIYGVMVTNYDYDETGNVTAQIMTREDIKQQKEYSTLLGYYIDARSIYEQILCLNYRLDKGIEDPLDLVPEYESLLDETSQVIIQLKAVDPPKSYAQAYGLLLNWVDKDLSSYLQEISSALSQNNAEHMQNALNDKERCYSDCYQLTANVINLGENIKGVNVSELKEWSPEEYIKEEMGEV